MGISRGIRSKGFKSNLERYIDAILKRNKFGYIYEPGNITYIQPEVKRRYLPDWTKDDVILEAKGRFTTADRKKMLLLKEQYPEKQIVMLFGKADNKLSKKSKTSYADWCNNNNIAWLDLADFEENPKCLLSITSKNKLGNLKTLLKMRKKHS